MEKLNVTQLSCFNEPAIGVWSNQDFYAAAFQEDHAIRLDIVRHDCKDGVTWDELREVKKNCGFGDYDAVEFYPHEKDVINTGNVRHLYIFTNPLPIVRRVNND
jgi:hypothetical protein